MKNRILFYLILSLISMTAYSQSDNYLWPIEGKKPGEGIIYQPQDYIKAEHNFEYLFIKAKEDSYIVAPKDGVVKFFSYFASLSLQHMFSNSNLPNTDSELKKKDLNFKKELAERMNKAYNTNFDSKYVSLIIIIKVGGGEAYAITGIRPYKLFKTGYKVKKGDTLGTIGYAYKSIPETAIGFSRSINTIPADPMSVFGLKTSFVPPTKNKTDYLTYKHSVQNLKEDFKIFRDALEEGHPGLYDYITENELNELFDRIKSKITEPITSNDFRKLLVPIINKIRDSHTALYAKRYVLSDKSMPPVKFGLKGDEMKIYQATDEYKDYLNKAVIKIDGKEIKDIKDEIKKFICGSDGFIESYPERYMFSSFLRLFEENTIKKEGDKITLTFSDGSEKEFTYQQIKDDDLKPAWNNDSPSEGTFQTKKVNNETAYIDINTFKLSQKDLDDITAFVKSIKDSLFNNIIIDVRDNGGGDINALNYLFSLIAQEDFKPEISEMVKNNNTFDFFKNCYNFNEGLNNIFPEFTNEVSKSAFYKPDEKFQFIKPNEDVNFRGEIYVLTNELSRSASGNFAGLVHKYKRGVIVGRETGSSYYQLNATKFARVNIENAGLELYMPLVKSTFEKKGDSDIPWGRGVIPDYKIEMEYDEFLKENNKGLEYTLELIDKIKKKRELKVNKNNRFYLILSLSLLIIGFVSIFLIRKRLKKKDIE